MCSTVPALAGDVRGGAGPRLRGVWVVGKGQALLLLLLRRCYVVLGGSSQVVLGALQEEACNWAGPDYALRPLCELVWSLAWTKRPPAPAFLRHVEGVVQDAERDWRDWLRGARAGRLVMLLWGLAGLRCQPCEALLEAASDRLARLPLAGVSSKVSKGLLPCVQLSQLPGPWAFLVPAPLHTKLTWARRRSRSCLEQAPTHVRTPAPPPAADPRHSAVGAGPARGCWPPGGGGHLGRALHPHGAAAVRGRASIAAVQRHAAASVVVVIGGGGSAGRPGGRQRRGGWPAAAAAGAGGGGRLVQRRRGRQRRGGGGR